VIYFDSQCVTTACAGSSIFWGVLRGLNWLLQYMFWRFDLLHTSWSGYQWQSDKGSTELLSKGKVNQTAPSSNHDTDTENWDSLKKAWRSIHYCYHCSESIPLALLLPDARRSFTSKPRFQAHSQLLSCVRVSDAVYTFLSFPRISKPFKSSYTRQDERLWRLKMQFLQQLAL